MRSLVRVLPWLAMVAAIAMLSGCAAVCGEDTTATAPPTPPKWVKPVTGAPAPVALPTTYTVEKCDDLWSISAKPQIYDDPWLWPLLWDANSGKIKDPNKIKEGTVLDVPRGVSDDAKAAARKKSAAFPKYVPPAGAKRFCPPK